MIGLTIQEKNRLEIVGFEVLPITVYYRDKNGKKHTKIYDNSFDAYNNLDEDNELNGEILLVLMGSLIIYNRLTSDRIYFRDLKAFLA
ncbi:MAG: hypothetical protein IJ593_04335 [Lachnospiraceae bacterium]|nr:hypothetical protein [Lachnospiraceae bacterium]